MTSHQEAAARGIQAIWDFYDAETPEERMRLANEIDAISPTVERGLCRGTELAGPLMAKSGPTQLGRRICLTVGRANEGGDHEVADSTTQPFRQAERALERSGRPARLRHFLRSIAAHLMDGLAALSVVAAVAFVCFARGM
jgi:hypothetical protein